jgi:hypothetical protein
MSGIHTGCTQGTRVKLLFKDNRDPVITKFKEEKGRVILTEDGKFKIKDLRAMMIHKPI